MYFILICPICLWLVCYKKAQDNVRNKNTLVERAHKNTHKKRPSNATKKAFKGYKKGARKGIGMAEQLKASNLPSI